MIFQPTILQGCYTIQPEPYSDTRGWFARYFCQKEFQQQIGHTLPWVQMNHSFAKEKGSIRGMHYQRNPFSEIKLIRCIAGAVYDVALDLRQDSPTFLQYFGTVLSAENKAMIYIPAGFAHGFQTLTDNCELLYHHTSFYTPEAEGGIRYNDPSINIQWPEQVTQISERDLQHSFIDSRFKGI